LPQQLDPTSQPDPVIQDSDRHNHKTGKEKKLDVCGPFLQQFAPGIWYEKHCHEYCRRGQEDGRAPAKSNRELVELTVSVWMIDHPNAKRDTADHHRENKTHEKADSDNRRSGYHLTRVHRLPFLSSVS
jgi:hypothetical protein